MSRIDKTKTFETWLNGLRDAEARIRIITRIRRAELGNLGDIAPVGEGVSEMRIHYGTGYRVYFIERKGNYIVLLGRGDKQTQKRDIRKALAMAKEV